MLTRANLDPDLSVFRKSSGTTAQDVEGFMRRPGQGGRVIAVKQSDLNAAGVKFGNNTKGTEGLPRRMRSGHGELMGAGSRGKVTGSQSKGSMGKAFCP